MSLVVTLKQNVGVTVSTRTVKVTLGRRGPQGPAGTAANVSWVVDYFGAFGPFYDVAVPAGVFGPLAWGPDYFLYQTPWGEYLTYQASDGDTIGCADYRDAFGNAVPANERIWTLTAGNWVLNAVQPLPSQSLVLRDWTTFGQWALGVSMILTGDGRMEETNLQHDRATFAHTTGLVFADSDGTDDGIGGAPIGTVFVDATAGPVLRTLDSSQQYPGREIVYVKTDASANSVSVDAAGGTIYPTEPTVLTAQWESVRLIFDGTNWFAAAGLQGPPGPPGPAGDPSAISALTGEPMGHPSLTASSFSFDNTSRTYTIQPTGASFDVWVRGVKFTKSTPQSVSVPNLSDLYFVSFDVTGTLVQSTSFFDLENCAPTAAVYWNATTGQAELVFDERHGVVMDWRTHQYLHLTRGAAMASGFDLSGYTLLGPGNVDTDAQVAVDDGVFYDEDIRVNPVNNAAPAPWTWQQRLAFPAEIPVFYRTGASEFTLDPATTFPVKQGTARIRYNQLTGGSWTTTDIANNRYGITWVVATNNVNYPVIGILGQAEYSSLPTAQAVAWNSLNLTGLPIAEMRPLWKLIFQTATGMGNVPHATLAAVSDLRAIVPLLIS